IKNLSLRERFHLTLLSQCRQRLVFNLCHRSLILCFKCLFRHIHHVAARLLRVQFDEQRQ
ncbi:hypothetical protein D027_4139B, partial [Vibrio parahaemolyticus 861]